MRAFFLTWPKAQTVAALSHRAKAQTVSAVLEAPTFPLPWSHYARMLAVWSANARAVYEAEALRGGWTMRQLARQIATQFYERTELSRDKAAMLTKGAKRKLEDAVSVEEELKDPLVLEFLGLKRVAYAARASGHANGAGRR